MQTKTNLNFKFLTVILSFLLASCSYGQANKTVTGVKLNNQNTDASISNLLKKQILLTNNAEFTNNRTLEGASGFLIKYKGASFAVTARHLLGEAGGVEPEVKTNELRKALKKWEMMPRVLTNSGKETLQLNVDGLDFLQSHSDVLLLKVVSNNFDIETLTPNFELPVVGETLYLIGCPYSEAGCKQNSYPVTFIEFDETENSLVCEMSSKVNLSGFSGAPLVNSKGEVLGVTVGSGALKGKNFVSATHIKEIQKIKL